MISSTINKSVCSSPQLIVYLEGELNPREEIELEKHLAFCQNCARALNEQKRMLYALDCAFNEDEKEFTFPDNFTKVVVANAESHVRGLRHPQERFKSLFVCATLFLLVLLGLGRETGNVFETFEKVAEQSLVVVGFALRLIHDIGVGVVVVLRFLIQHYIFNSTLFLLILLIFFIAAAFLCSHLFCQASHARKLKKKAF